MSTAHKHTRQDGERFDVVLGSGQTRMTPRTKLAKQSRYISPFKYLSIAGDVGFAVVVPIVLAFIFGPQLDVRWGTGYVMTSIFVTCGLLMAVFSLSRRIKDIVR